MKKTLKAVFFGSTALATSMCFLPLSDLHANNFNDYSMDTLSKTVSSYSSPKALSPDLFNSVHLGSAAKVSNYTNVAMSKEEKITLAAKAAAATYRYMPGENDKRTQDGVKQIETRLNLGEQYVFGGNNIEGEAFSQGGHIFYNWNKETGRHELSIAFRGTETGADWGYNFDAQKVKNVKFAGKEMTLHAGFYKRYMAMRESLTKNLNKILIEKGITDFSKMDITVTGHSLGGGLAGIGAVDLKYFFDKIAQMHKSAPVTSFDVVTFAQPRFAGKRTAKWITEYLGEENITRVWASFDLVTAVGPGFMGFKHVGSSGGYMLDSFSWFASTNPVSFHSMTNYLEAILNKQEMVAYKGKLHGIGRQAQRAATTIQSALTSVWKKFW